MAKESNFWIWKQKCYRNSFLGHFEILKEYGRHCHRYFGKVKYFWVIWITKWCHKQDFVQGGFKRPPSPNGRVKRSKLTYFAIIYRWRGHKYWTSPKLTGSSVDCFYKWSFTMLLNLNFKKMPSINKDSSFILNVFMINQWFSNNLIMLF